MSSAASSGRRPPRLPRPRHTRASDRHVDATYAQEYRELYERHWWWRARERFILDELARLRPAAGWGAILDVGCGDALFFDALSRFGDVEGVEPDASLVTPNGPH